MVIRTSSPIKVVGMLAPTPKAVRDKVPVAEKPAACPLFAGLRPIWLSETAWPTKRVEI
jgi:hypothetical protein